MQYYLYFIDNRLFESANTLRGENIQLTVANETLRREAASGTPGLSVNADLEARLLKQAEELATLHKRKGEHTQQIVDLNNKLQEMLKELQIKEARYVCLFSLTELQILPIIYVLYVSIINLIIFVKFTVW